MKAAKRILYLMRIGPGVLLAFAKVVCSRHLRRALRLLNEEITQGAHFNVSQDDLLIGKRIIDNYNAQADAYELLIQDKSKAVYEISPVWKHQIEERRREYIHCLKQRKEKELAGLLASFFTNSGSEGISEPTDYGRRATIANARAVLLAQKWRDKLMELEAVSRVSCKHLYDTPAIGRPYRVQSNGSALHSGSLYYLAHVYEILRNTDLDVDGQYLFVDLGAGYGCILKFLLQLFPRSRAIVFDIPPILIFSSYYLSRNFPDKRIGFYQDVGSSPLPVNQYDITLCPHWKVEDLRLQTVDLFINTGSLPEMSWNAALHYLGMIKQLVKPGGYFYTYNTWPTVDTRHGPEHGLGELLEATAIEKDFDTISYGDIVIYPNSIWKKLVLKKKVNSPEYERSCNGPI